MKTRSILMLALLFLAIFNSTAWAQEPEEIESVFADDYCAEAGVEADEHVCGEDLLPPNCEFTVVGMTNKKMDFVTVTNEGTVLFYAENVPAGTLLVEQGERTIAVLAGSNLDFAASVLFMDEWKDEHMTSLSPYLTNRLTWVTPTEDTSSYSWLLYNNTDISNLLCWDFAAG